MVFKQIEDTLTSSEFNGIVSLFRKHTPIKHMVELQDNINTPYGTIKLDIEDTILLDTGILISEETITAEPTLKLVSPTFPHSNYHITLDIIHYTGANIFDTTPSSYEVKDTITIDLPVNTTVQIPVENLQKGYIISLNAILSITHDKTVITGRPPVLTLTSDKTVLSAYDGDTTVLTASYSQDDVPIPDTVVTFYNGANSIGTATTDNNGEATITYTAVGSGDLSLTAKVGTLVSETYTIEDCYAYVTSVSNWTSHTNKGTSFLFSPFVLPTNHRIEFKLKSTNAIRIACGDTTHTNSGGWLEWIYAWYVDNEYLYYRDSSNGEKSTTSTYTVSTSSVYAIEYNGTSLKLFSDSTELNSITSYDTLILTRYIRLNANTGTVANNLDWIKVKPL